MNDILFLSHFHKEFPFNFKSSWLKASYAGGKAPFAWAPPFPGEWINTTQNPSIHEYQHYYRGVEENDFLRAMGQQATEYYLWKHGNADYIGVGSYRRYLLILGHDDAQLAPVVKLGMPATLESAEFLSSEEQKNAALKLLETYDVITNKQTPIGISVEEQYLQSQPKHYWDLFLEAINELMPDYRQHMNWFKGNQINFETSYIMRKQMFRKYVSELFEIYEYIWQRCDSVYPTQQTTSEIYPWRYPGFLGERFFPFFIHANALNAIHVPLVMLE